MSGSFGPKTTMERRFRPARMGPIVPGHQPNEGSDPPGWFMVFADTFKMEILTINWLPLIRFMVSLAAIN